MSTFIVGGGIYEGQSLEAMAALPDFRRATRNMCLAVSALSGAIAPFGAKLKALGPRLGLVVATSHGEMETTAAFLAELGKTGVARPLLFQNSLHNATLGFLTRHFNLTGPSLTVSNHYTSGEDAIGLAELLLSGPEIDAALVIGVDCWPQRLDHGIPYLYPAGHRPVEGAAVIVMANKAGLERLGIDALARLDSIDYKAVAATSPFRYDSDGVELLYRAIQNPTVTESLSVKPDGTSIRIRFTRASP